MTRLKEWEVENQRLVAECNHLKPKAEIFSELVEALKAEHNAIDTLWAHLIRLDPQFFPSKSATWGAALRGKAALTKAEALKGDDMIPRPILHPPSEGPTATDTAQAELAALTDLLKRVDRIESHSGQRWLFWHDNSAEWEVTGAWNYWGSGLIAHSASLTEALEKLLEEETK